MGSNGGGLDNQQDASRRQGPGILRRANPSRTTREAEPVSSVARRHRDATREEERGYEEEELMEDEEGMSRGVSEEEGRSDGYESETSFDQRRESSKGSRNRQPTKGRTRRGNEEGNEEDMRSSTRHRYEEESHNRSRQRRHREEGNDTGSYHRHRREEEGDTGSHYRNRSDTVRKGTTSKKLSSSRPRLYAIACGRGGVQSTGLYRADWDEVQFLLSGFSRAKYKRVKDEDEGLDFIRRSYQSRRIKMPRWAADNEVHYPRIRKLRHFLGEEDLESESDGYVTPRSDSDVEPRPKAKTKVKASAVVGMDASIGKEGELFGVNLKNVINLERGLAPSNLGKHTISLLLEQIDDVTAYPRHANHRNSEGLGDFVEAVADISQDRQGRKEGSRDTGWKGKTRNALA